MKRREFCRSTLAAAVATTIPSQQLLAAGIPFMTGVSASVSALTSSGEETTLAQSVVKNYQDSLPWTVVADG